MPLANEAVSAPRSTIVVIDDSLTVLAAVRQSLERQGFDVHTATDPAQLASGDVEDAALVVIDVQMEQVFGDDAVLVIRDVWNVRAPILLYSSLPREELEQRARAAGADGAVCKADGVEALSARVKQLVAGA